MSRSSTVAGLFLAVFLVGLGIGIDRSGPITAGACISSLVLFSGGLLSTEEPAAVRVSLVVFGGLTLLVLLYSNVLATSIMGLF